MTDYTKFKAEWALLTPGTTAEKLAQINAMTVTGAVPTVFSVSGVQIYNCLVPAEFQALSVANQQYVRDIFNLQGAIPAGTGTTVQTVLLAIFGSATVTRANLVALAQAVVQPWWEANGYTSPFNINDCIAAGVS